MQRLDKEGLDLFTRQLNLILEFKLQLNLKNFKILQVIRTQN